MCIAVTESRNSTYMKIRIEEISFLVVRNDDSVTHDRRDLCARHNLDNIKRAYLLSILRRVRRHVAPIPYKPKANKPTVAGSGTLT